MPPQNCPASTDRPGPPATTLIKPPLPLLSSNRSRNNNPIEVQLPPLIAGALIAAFATAVADGLGNELLTHYYLSDQRVQVNLDRVLDRLIAEFTGHLWDELFDFYQASNANFSNQVTRLFEGPIRQIVLILNGPEVTRCILDKIGPSLSRRPITWSETSKGIDLPLALQLVCTYWHREFSSRSPGGNPEEIARSIYTQMINGSSARKLLAGMKEILFSPYFVQMFLMESAMCDIIQKRRRPPPYDGFHALQLRFEVQFFDTNSSAEIMRLLNISSLPVITGSAERCISTTIADYTSLHWPRSGRYLVKCLEEALRSAAQASLGGGEFAGMSLLEGDDEQEASGRGLRLLLVEVERGFVRLNVSAWLLSLVDILQQMAWVCAALSASPVPDGTPAESALQVFDWRYEQDSTFINCNIRHRELAQNEGPAWLRQHKRPVIASGFPIDGPRLRSA